MTTLLKMHCPDCRGNLAETDGKDTWCLMCTRILEEKVESPLKFIGERKGQWKREQREARDEKIFELSSEGVLDIALKLGVCQRTVQRALKRRE